MSKTCPHCGRVIEPTGCYPPEGWGEENACWEWRVSPNFSKHLDVGAWKIRGERLSVDAVALAAEAKRIERELAE